MFLNDLCRFYKDITTSNPETPEYKNILTPVLVAMEFLMINGNIVGQVSQLYDT